MPANKDADRFDPITAFDVVEDLLASEMAKWPKDRRGTFAWKLRILADRLCKESGVTVSEVLLEPDPAHLAQGRKRPGF